MKKLFLLAALAAAVIGCSNSDSGWDESVIPVTLIDIEAVNVDNSGEFPAVAAGAVKKDAYMLGVKWVTDNTPTDDDIFITGPVVQGDQTFGAIADGYSKAVRCLTPFNSSTPAGSYVSRFFKEVDRDYLPADVNEGFVLLVSPEPGQYNFRVEYYLGNQLKFFSDVTAEFF